MGELVSRSDHAGKVFIGLLWFRKDSEEAIRKVRRRRCALTVGCAYEGGDFDDGSQEFGGYTPCRWQR